MCIRDSVKSEEEMKGLFPYAWEAVENTQRIADRCNVEIEFGVTKLPKYDVPEGYDSAVYKRQAPRWTEVRRTQHVTLPRIS